MKGLRLDERLVRDGLADSRTRAQALIRARIPYLPLHAADIDREAASLSTLILANVGALSFEGANPRHEHEWVVFKEFRLPDGLAIIPGVIDTTTNFVEHPELVAQRIVRYAEVVGRENVIAGTDCGLSTFVRTEPTIDPRIAWAKLKSLAEGAAIASKKLWN